MCSTIQVVAYDGLIIVGLILLIVWVLAMVDVVHIQTHGLKHVFVILAAVFVIAWIFSRCCCRRSPRKHTIGA
ncbi:hypothetical protein EDD21DRAFT_448628 [Dissophora ornata]|nr:hypothetical protein EDD21DRAFT_448628 [Dissophora ornata]